MMSKRPGSTAPIGAVAPRAAARRVLARQSFEALTRGYDGAARGRRTEGWRAPGTSADAEIARGRGAVARPHARSGAQQPACGQGRLGAGQQHRRRRHHARAPRAATTSSTAKVDELWKRWSAQLRRRRPARLLRAADAGVPRDDRGRRGSAAPPPAAVERRAAVPLQIQMHGGRSSWTQPESGDLADGGRILQGIEYDPIGRRRAYWLYRRSIPATTPSSLRRGWTALRGAGDRRGASLRAAARAGRGVPWGAPVMRALPRSRRLDASRAGAQEDRGLRRRHRLRRRRGQQGDRAVGGRCRRQPGRAVRARADRLCARRQGHQVQPAGHDGGGVDEWRGRSCTSSPPASGCPTSC